MALAPVPPISPSPPVPLRGGRRVAVLATGGTIAGLASKAAAQEEGYKAAELSVQELLQTLPEDFAARPAHIAAEQVAQVDSKDMGVPVWNALALRCAHYLADAQTDGIVIAHGTDTLEETAWFLHRVLPASGKPVVLVCAMRPADSPEADGPRNLADGLAVAQADGMAGVMLVCAGRVHGARHVQKVHPWRLDAFASVDAAPLGDIHNGVFVPARQGRGGGAAQSTCGAYAGYLSIARREPARAWPKVAVIASHAAADADVVHALAQAGFDGLVVQATGNGSLHEALLPALHAAARRGVRIWLVTRCPQGCIAGFANRFAFHVSPLHAFKARIDLALSLMNLPSAQPVSDAGRG